MYFPTQKKDPSVHAYIVHILAHELGHFYNYWHAKGLRGFIGRFAEWCRLSILILLATGVITIAKIAPQSSAAIPSFACLFSTSVTAMYILRRTDERNANAFCDKLIAEHNDLLAACITVVESKKNRQ